MLHGGLNCSFPLTVQALASRDYAEEVKGGHCRCFNASPFRDLHRGLTYFDSIYGV